MTVPAPETVVLFSTADWNAPYWTNKQHIAQRLAARGARVLYIESTGLRRPRVSARDLSRVAGRLRRTFQPLRRVDENLWVHAPLTIPIGHRHGIVRALNGFLLERTVRNWLRQYGRGPVTVWTYHPYVQDALVRLPVDRLVYHCVDDIAAIPGVDAGAFRAAEAELLARADQVFTTSPRLQEHCSAIAGARSTFERNVADIDHFAQARGEGTEPADLAGMPHPRLAYVGVLSDYKLDLPLIEACMLARPDWHWLFVGEEPEGYASPVIARLKRAPNAHFLGYRPYAQLPAYLSAIDIAVLPNLLDGYMASVFPMKLYEYLAAGKPVLSTPMPALGDMDGIVVTARTDADWIAAIGAMLEAPPPAIALDDPALADYSWDARLDRMLTRLATA